MISNGGGQRLDPVHELKGRLRRLLNKRGLPRAADGSAANGGRTFRATLARSAVAGTRLGRRVVEVVVRRQIARRRRCVHLASSVREHPASLPRCRHAARCLGGGASSGVRQWARGGFGLRHAETTAARHHLRQARSRHLEQ